MSDWVNVGHSLLSMGQRSRIGGGNQSDDAKPKLPSRILPMYSPNPDFFGRLTELEELDKHLLPRKNNQESQNRHYAICGPGGVGKTDPAVEWFY